MKISINFVDEFGRDILEDYAHLMEHYRINIFHDGVFKQQEVYFRGELQRTIYQIVSEDEIKVILRENPNSSFHLETNTSEYLISKHIGFIEGKLDNKSNEVYTLKGNLFICRHEYDVATDVIAHSRTIKILYDDDGYELYEFQYFSDGRCMYVNHLQEYQADFYPHNIGVDPSIDFTWEGFEYYKNSEPLIP